MRKKYISIFLILVILMLSIAITPVFATTYYYDSGYEIYHDSNIAGWTINSCSLISDEIKLPEVLLSDSVTTIGGSCFENNYTLYQIDIPDSFTTIGAYAFSGCKSLSNVHFSSQLTNIYTGAFRYCDSLKTVDLSETKLSQLASTVFYRCESLESVILPSSLNSIGSNAFAGCPDLNKLFIDNNVNSIANNAFSNSPNVVIYCYDDSYAHQFAVNNSVEYVLLDLPVIPDPTETPTEIEPTMVPTEEPTQADGYFLGDVNGDGVVDIIDATLIQRYCAKLLINVEFEILHGDVNENNSVDDIDATLIRRFLAGVEVYYPIGEWKSS